MRISRTEYNKFATMYAQGVYEGQRFGQAWYNHFKMHAHNASIVDRIILDNLYNETNKDKARHSILQNFTDDTQ